MGLVVVDSRLVTSPTRFRMAVAIYRVITGFESWAPSETSGRDGSWALRPRTRPGARLGSSSCAERSRWLRAVGGRPLDEAGPVVRDR
jgi:hypothetical protein